MFEGVQIMITMLKSKIHRATVIESNINYEGSCAIDEELMFLANIRQYEQLHIFNVNTGQRLVTYAIPSDIKGMISLNGSAARCGVAGDKIIICTYHHVSELEEGFSPALVMVDDINSPKV